MIGCGGQSPRERAPRLPPHPLLHVRTYKKVPRTRNLTLPWPQVCLDPEFQPPGRGEQTLLFASPRSVAMCGRRAS